MNKNIRGYQKQLKENINLLLSQNRLEEVKEILGQYENIVQDDIDTYSIKAVVAMMEGDFCSAEDILISGLEHQSFNKDILYNLAYLYEAQGKYITAYRCYKKLTPIVDQDMLVEVTTKMQELEKIEAVRMYASRKKVLFIAHIFPPVGGSGVQRSLKFVKYLRSFGWEPVVVTVGKTMYPFEDKTMVSEIPDEVEVIRIDEATNVDIKYAQKIIQLNGGVINDQNLMEEYMAAMNKSQDNINQMLFLPDPYILWATEVLDKLDDKVDINEMDMIYSTSGPYSDHVVGFYLKQRYNKPWVADFRDEWTNNPYIQVNKKDILYKVSFAMEKNIVKFADQVIAVTPVSSKNYINIFKIDHNKITTITNGYDEEDFSEITNCVDRKDKFTIMHNGMLYMIRTPLTFMKALQNLIKRGKVNKSKLKVNFGFTENKEQWEKIRDDLGLADAVEFLDYMSHEESLKMANGADCLLLIVGDGEKNKSVFPGKVFEYLRLRKPILALSPRGSVVDELIKQTNRGKNVDFNDVKGMENYILELYKSWEAGNITSLPVTEEVAKYERRNTTNKLSTVFAKASEEYKVLDYQFTEKSSNFYDELFESGGWNDTYFKHYSETHYYEIWLKAVDLLNKIDNPQIIEIGCGPGQFANLLFDNQLKDYRGIDFSQEAIKYAKTRNEQYKDLFSVDNAYTTELFDREYNTVIIFEVLEHVDEDLKILDRVKKNSNILFSVPNFYSDGHVRWFNSNQEVINHYKEYVDIENILSFSVGGPNKIFLVQGKTKGQ